MCQRPAVVVFMPRLRKDWNQAADLLPADRWGTNGERATKASAYGMLAKLYLTMASAATANSAANVAHPFTAEKLMLSITDCRRPTLIKPLISIISWSQVLISRIYSGLRLSARRFCSHCILNRVLMVAGSSRQVHFARSKYLDGGDDYYGGEKV